MIQMVIILSVVRAFGETFLTQLTGFTLIGVKSW